MMRRKIFAILAIAAAVLANFLVLSDMAEAEEKAKVKCGSNDPGASQESCPNPYTVWARYDMSTVKEVNVLYRDKRFGTLKPQKIECDGYLYLMGALGEDDNGVYTMEYYPEQETNYIYNLSDLDIYLRKADGSLIGGTIVTGYSGVEKKTENITYYCSSKSYAAARGTLTATVEGKEIYPVQIIDNSSEKTFVYEYEYENLGEEVTLAGSLSVYDNKMGEGVYDPSLFNKDSAPSNTISVTEGSASWDFNYCALRSSDGGEPDCKGEETIKAIVYFTEKGKCSQWAFGGEGITATGTVTAVSVKNSETGEIRTAKDDSSEGEETEIYYAPSDIVTIKHYFCNNSGTAIGRSQMHGKGLKLNTTNGRYDEKPSSDLANGRGAVLGPYTYSLATETATLLRYRDNAVYSTSGDKLPESKVTLKTVLNYKAAPAIKAAQKFIVAGAVPKLEVSVNILAQRDDSKTNETFASNLSSGFKATLLASSDGDPYDSKGVINPPSMTGDVEKKKGYIINSPLSITGLTTDASSKVCYKVRVENGWYVSGNLSEDVDPKGTVESAPVCLIVAGVPRFDATNSSLLSNGGVTGGNNASQLHSTVESGIVARGQISKVSSGLEAGAANGLDLSEGDNSSHKFIALAIGKKSQRSPSTDGYGATYAKYAIDDFEKNLAAFKARYRGSSDNVTEVNGTHTISDDIKATDNDSVPIIIAKDILIEPGVTQIDAILIADTIKTCAAVYLTDVNSNCKNPLTFNAPVVANNLFLWRTTTGGQAAETFNYSPRVYRWAHKQSQLGDLMMTSYVKELPARY